MTVDVTATTAQHDVRQTVARLVRPFAVFGFYDLPKERVSDEIDRLLERR